MASHVFSIGTPTNANNSILTWEPPGGDRAIPSSLGSGFLRTLELRIFNPAIYVATSSSDSTSGFGDSGPELSSAWEGSSVAVTINAPGISYSIGGPNSSDATSKDTTEPYGWSVSSSERTRIVTFIRSFNLLTSQQQAAATLTLDDGIAPHADAHTDTPHADQHTDGAHQDTPHTDTAHVNQHTNTPHTNTIHSDEAHQDVAHSDTHSDTVHSDTAHLDGAHQDVAHSDTHSDTAHSDTAHSDTTHVNTHLDHNDAVHSDVAHSDTHSDTAHLDLIHLDTAHSDTAHSDTARVNTHLDTTHVDTHLDSHTDAATTTQGETIIAHWLLEFKGLDYTVWSGEGDLNYNEKVYKGAGRFIELSQLDYQVDQPNNRLTATLVAGSEEVQQIFVSDDKIYLVEIQWIISIDGGVNFSPTGREYLGRTNGPTYSNGQYTIEIEPTLSDQFRQQPVYWSDEEQQAKYPGDLGLNFASDLIDGVKKGKWPR